MKVPLAIEEIHEKVDYGFKYNINATYNVNATNIKYISIVIKFT